MAKSLQSWIQVGGMLTVLFTATTVSPSKASAESLLPKISVLESGQVCLALCNSSRTAGSDEASSEASDGPTSLPSQLMQLPGQALQPPGQMPPGAPPAVVQPPKQGFLQKIAPVLLPVVIQQLAR